MFTIPDTVRGLIFDCDGTLADTMPLHLTSWQTAMRRLGGDITPDEFWGHAGRPTTRIIELLNERHGYGIDPAAGAELKEQMYLETLDRVTAIEPVAAIARAQHGRLPMAVATGGQQYVVRRTLARIGLLDLFPPEAIVTADDVPRGKPAPDIFLECARRMGVEPTACCVFEDADNGLAGARAAGMLAIDVRDHGLGGP